MKVAILLNRPHARLRTLGKQALTRGWELVRGRGGGAPVLPEFDAFAGLLDPSPVVFGTDAAVDWAALARCDLVVWEWGWTETPPARALEIRRRTDVPLLVFPGPLDRFWREVDPAHLDLHFEALRATDGIGVMLRDTVALYASLAPAAHVFHMPVPVDVARFAAYAPGPGERDPERVLLTAPTRFCGPASQLPIATFLAFARLRARHPRLTGLCFCYDDEERRQTERVLGELGLAGHVEVRDFVRPLGRYLEQMRTCGLALSLPHAMIQGRMALLAACLGLPCVLGDDSETHRALYPDTSVRWHDVDAAIAAATRLLGDRDFAERVVAGARAAVAYYDVPRATARLRAAAETLHARRALREGA